MSCKFYVVFVSFLLFQGQAYAEPKSENELVEIAAQAVNQILTNQKVDKTSYYLSKKGEVVRITFEPKQSKEVPSIDGDYGSADINSETGKVIQVLGGCC